MSRGRQLFALFLIVLLVGWISGTGSWIVEHLDRILNVLIGGVLASLLAGVILWQVDKRRWDRIDVSHRKLLEALKDALGGPLIRGLLSCYPATGDLVARILSDNADMLYRLHHRRLSIRAGQDVYTICGLEEFPVGDGVALFWRVGFITTWTWINDSTVPHSPLQSFRVIVSAPDASLEAFQPHDTTPMETQKNREEFRDFLLTENYVRLVIVHPLGTRWDARDMDTLVTIKSLEFISEGSTTSVDVSNRRKAKPDAKMPTLSQCKLRSGWPVYTELQLVGRIRELELAPGATLKVKFTGEFLLPVDNEGVSGCHRGILAYSPSDVVAEFSLVLQVPSSVESGENTIDLVPDGQVSYWEDGFGHHHAGATTVLDRARGSNSLELQVADTLPGFHRFVIGWRGEAREGASAVPRKDGRESC